MDDCYFASWERLAKYLFSYALRDFHLMWADPRRQVYLSKGNYGF